MHMHVITHPINACRSRVIVAAAANQKFPNLRRARLEPFNRGKRTMVDRRGFLVSLGAGTALLGRMTPAAAAARARDAKGTGPTPTLADDEAIRALLRRRVDVGRRTVGMAACVVTPERTRVVTWGRERLSDDQLVRPNTVFEIGSITKVFTALLLANMARRGEVELDDPAERHLPGHVRLPSFDGHRMTLADLATHTSGLPRWPPVTGTPASPAWVDALSVYAVDELGAWLGELRLQRAPGTGWEYSNVGYAVLGLALSHRAGRPFEALLHERVIAAVGLRDTGFTSKPELAARLAEGHDAALRPVPPFRGGIFAPAGGLRSTPSDIARFAAAVLPGGGGSLEPEGRLTLTVRRPAPAIGGSQALGWEVRNAPGGAFVVKDGVTWGQTASLAWDPDGRVAIAVFSNALPDLRSSTPSGGGIGAADLARHLLRPQIPMDGEGGTTY
jgi:D-alanyl-D-alanine-carboxypeptidase/D-alanyl-D-alanine-endopeptidase